MPAKLTLTKKFWCENKYGILMDHGGNQSNRTRDVNFVPKDVQKIISSSKISRKYNEQ